MNSLLTKLYLFKFFDDFVLIYPLYTIMFADYGIEPWQIATLLSIWALTAFILEVPSGVWADKYSRKNILFIGQLIRAFGYIIWLLFPNFIGFLIGFILWGIKSALTSGTYQSLIYDTLKNTGEEKQFSKVLGRTKTFSFIAILLASLLASPLITYGYPFILILSTIAVLISGVLIFVFPKIEITKSTNEKEYFSILKEGLITSFKNPIVLSLIVFLSLAFTLGGALDEFWTIFASGVGLPKYGLGIFVMLMSGSQGIASFIAYRFESRSNKFFYALFILSGVILFIAGYFYVIPSLVLLILFSFMFTIILVVFESKLHHSISSYARATISSVSSFFTEIGSVILFLSFGFIAQLSSYRSSFVIFGIIVTLIGAIYLLLPSRKLSNLN